MKLEYEIPATDLSFVGMERAELLVMDHMAQMCKREHVRNAVAYINGRSVGGVVFEETP